MTSHVQPEVILPEEHSEDAQIVVDLKKLGVDLDKDVGRSIQKSQEENAEVGVSKERLKLLRNVSLTYYVISDTCKIYLAFH